MNLLFITHYSSLYGANRSLLALLDGLNSKEGDRLFVLIPRSGDLEEELSKREISYTKLPFKSWMAESRLKMLFRLIANLIILPLIILKIRSWKIDLIYTNSSVTPVGAWVGYLSRLPHIWHVREFGWEDYNYRYDLGRKLFEYWLNRSDYIITISKSIRQKVLRNITAPIYIVYNGVISKEKAEKLNTQSLVNKDKKKIFGIIGLLCPAKGQDQAIKAFGKIQKEYPRTELWLAGTGREEYEEYLYKLASECNVSETVRFKGYIDDPFDFYSKIDIALVCSKNEGMGRVTAEAMVAGKIIIGLDNAGTSELIEDGKTGLLYDGSVSSLYSKMELAINNDLTDLTVNAREKGLNNFLIEDYANEIENIIHSVLQLNE